MGRKIRGGAVPPFLGGLGPNLTECGLGQGPPRSTKSGILIHPAVWSQWTWAEKWGRGFCAPFWGGELGHLGGHLTQCRLGRGLQSGIFIHPAVWHNTNVTDRQTGHDRQRSDSIGRTVLQTVAQKLLNELIM